MSPLGYDDVRAVLRGDTDAILPPIDGRPPTASERLIHAIESLGSAEESVGPFDLAQLVRQVLLKEGHERGVDLSLTVPLGPPWPTPEQWRAASCVPVHSTAWCEVRAKPWAPDWLSDAPFLDAVREVPRRNESRSVPSDPALSELFGEQYSHYQGEGQRAVVHAAFFCAPGSTLLGMLPTGTGKSLVFQLASAVHTEHGGTVVVVVPTTSLAVDQERALREVTRSMPGTWPDDFAYFHDLEPERRSDLRRRIRSGTQRVVFTSPESLVNSLRPALYDAAGAGLLPYFVVDEAHVAAGWGTEFRPQFQAMAGLRAGLLEACPAEQRLRTLLLTATLGSDGFDLLRDLFRGAGRFDVISGLHLRPEPTYWFHHSPDDSHRSRVVEACRHLPRPFVLYTSLKNPGHSSGSLSAREWYGILGDAGIRRVRVVDGDTSRSDREAVIEAWRSGEVDGVIATSSFGLGVDLANVRAVLHACVPETVDRYYQEVGRGGRDGKASASLVVWRDSDVSVAEGLNRQKVIGAKKGAKHWHQLWTERRSVGEGAWALNLSTVMPWLQEDSPENRQWNVRTLTLLARARMIRLVDRPPDREDPVDDDDQRVPILVVQTVAAPSDLADPGFWARPGGGIIRARERIHAATKQSLAWMMELLNGNAEVGSVLQAAFELPGQPPPVHVCAGCPRCRSQGHPARQYTLPEPHPLRDPWPRLDDARFDGGPSLVFYQPGSRLESRRLRSVIQDLVTLGFADLTLPADLWMDRELRGLWRRAPARFVVRRTHVDQDTVALPRVTVWPNEVDRDLRQLLLPAVDPHLVFLPEDTPDPANPRRLLREVRQHQTLIALKESL
ncbi:MAG: DEAD/DEAH box helicase [Deltaproteobacteria bacterium]|nr:MAG: DEAD/DEAH box helicase [Deltaproteobacteria bacterium]